MNKLLIICGPTATGKTALAAELAKKFNGELVSADSRQVYRGMDLVTGKDRPNVPIWLYDVVNPDEDFSVSHWLDLARTAIEDIQKRKKLPIVVGGTGLYIHALLHPLDSIDIPPNAVLRKELQELTVVELQDRVQRENMNDSDWNNSRRLIRKIEIATNPPVKSKNKNFDTFIIGLTAPLDVLDSRIDDRLRERKEMGLEKEVTSFLGKYDRNLPSMSAIGVNEHAYARRQMTWFKKQKNIHWFDIQKETFLPEVMSFVQEWYT